MLCGMQVAGPVKVQYKWLFLSTPAFMPGFPADKFSTDSSPVLQSERKGAFSTLASCHTLSFMGQSPALLLQVAGVAKSDYTELTLGSESKAIEALALEGKTEGASKNSVIETNQIQCYI